MSLLLLLRNASSSGTTSYVAEANTGADEFVTSRSVSKPGGVVSGDYVVFWLMRWDGSSFPAVTPPSGATLRSTITNGNIQTLCYLLKVSNESSFAFSWTGSRWAALSANFFTGVDPNLNLSTAPFQAASGAAAPISTLSVTTVNGAALAWNVNTLDTSSGITHTPPTSFTENADVAPWSTAYRISPGSGSQSATSATFSPSQIWAAGLVALAPAGSGADISDGDTISGAEGTPQIGIIQSDTGLGTENQSLAVALSNSDTGTGAESTARISQTLTDSVGSTENNSLAVSFSQSDTATGTEAQIVAPRVSDTVAGTESQTSSASLSQSDSGALTENAVIYISSSDSVSSLDQQSVSVNLSNSDAITATEQTVRNLINQTEIATAIENQLSSASFTVTESISSADSQSTQATFTQSDSGSGADNGSVSQDIQKSDLDTVVGADSQGTSANLNFNDSISSQETERLNLAGQDIVSGVENQSIRQSQSDNITASESQVIYIFSSDGVIATDSQSLAATVAQADSASLQDMWIVDAILASTDLVSATEHEEAREALGLSAEFSTPFLNTSIVLTANQTYIASLSDNWSATLRSYTEDV